MIINVTFNRAQANFIALFTRAILYLCVNVSNSEIINSLTQAESFTYNKYRATFLTPQKSKRCASSFLKLTRLTGRIHFLLSK